MCPLQLDVPQSYRRSASQNRRVCVNVCQSVCACVLYTKPGQHSCSTLSLQKVSLKERSLLSLLNPGWMFVVTVSVFECTLITMSIISIIYEVFQVSFLLYVQETPLVLDFSPTSLFKCASQYCVRNKQIENEGDPSNITEVAEVTVLTMQERLRKFSANYSKLLLATVAGFVCFVKIYALMVVVSPWTDPPQKTYQLTK